MNLIKTYKIANRKKGQVEFGSQHGGKWIFKARKWQKIMKVPGGLAVAEKIADAIHKSLLRTDTKEITDDSQRIDGRCRITMDALCKVRTLKDYTGEPEWWSNTVPEMPALPVEVPMGVSPEDLGIPSIETENEVLALEAVHS